MNNNTKKVTPINKPLKGNFKVPSDKSISHRAAMFASLVHEPVLISNFSLGSDCLSTLSVLEALGVKIEFQSKNSLIINNKEGFKEPKNILDAGNSGTTIRLMTGILAGHDFYCVLTGDESLRKRPMARVISPLKEMGANIWARDNDTKAPVSIKGRKLQGINYNSPVASAQVKSSILLAGLHSEGITTVKEPVKSRDHTERMLEYLNANIMEQGTKVTIGASELVSKPITIPGDISSAAFFLVAGAIIADSEIIIQDVGLNPTRTGIIDVLKQMGAEIEILNQRVDCNEEIGDIKVNYSNLKAITIDSEIIPRIIDEIPIIAVAATQAEGTTIIKGAEELRHKESDRIKAVYTELKKLGAEIEEQPDGLIIHGKTKLKGGCTLETYHDHRIAMSAYIAGLIADSPIEINEFHWVNISFPEFTGILDKLSF
ncbi:MAG: 3-phosphoshikimate 1-carboxyvinyltransferase [Candidatus Melainabacteria bacterium GWA2_34_9]|nr:MAG: 3-phosphoshikimate 1-carboxyvinyltransferase [Candidatus Melainabacteria bacterium GWA2_34_9]